MEKGKILAFAIVLIALAAVVGVFIWKGSSWNPYAVAPQPGLGFVGLPNVPTGIDTYQG